MLSLSPKTPDIRSERFEAAVRAAENVLYDLTRPGTHIIGDMAREIAAAVLTAALSPDPSSERAKPSESDYKIAGNIARTWCRTPDDFYECQAAIAAALPPDSAPEAASDYETAHRIIDALVEAAYMAVPMDRDAVNIVTKILSGQTTNDEA